eukprot:CAMPEP_0119264170 /NCGR_PEP_ID=MMETSP1329-20130426/3325_1 /TAXON_ID=114041 /ORGANISM="Genus nov. species nov., Strain RCC1024" /LENGTH=208 /DNA_ID=CAMNT_0007263915 /DNA_START=114 /DNA_END=737 /DNA_ORIENTATION=+
MLARATSSEESPTPGYMYGEIARMTLASFDACRDVEDYLVKRCGNKNANVKLKALVIIRHVCDNGAPAFRKDLCRQLPAIKDCLHFTGPPDALRGDDPYRRVREAAREAVEAVTHDPGGGGGAPGLGRRMEGFAGDGGGGYGPGGGGHPTPPRYEGYGNSPTETEPTTLMGRAARLAETACERAAAALQGAPASHYVGGAGPSTGGAA